MALSLSVLLLLWVGLLFFRVKAPLGFAVIAPKLTAGALSPHTAAVGTLWALLCALLGWIPAAAVAALAAIGAGAVFIRLTARHSGFEQAFGPAWQDSIPPGLRNRMLLHRWSWRMPSSPEPRWQRDLPFWTIPGSDRRLLCDLWQPPVGVEPSGVAILYFHGSAWYILDKDVATRPQFRHWTAQGHVVMDVAYRLYPEAGVPEMVGDVKRAIAFMKAHAAEFGVDPDRIVLAGGSAGGHLALLAGYTPDHPDLTPADVAGVNLEVRGIVSCYGPADLKACFYHTGQDRTTRPGDVRPDFDAEPSGLWRALLGPGARRLRMQAAAVAGRLDWLLGGRPDEAPARYELCSPVTHVHAGCPPTLLLQGEHDLIAPARATRELHRKLQEAGVPVVNVILPLTEHGFDLVLPTRSPAAQAAIYDIDRFLALMARP